MTDLDWARIAGWSALIAGGATVAGAVSLVLFFRSGGRWGTANDIASIVLMLAMIPVAFVVGVIELEIVTTIALVVTALGVLGMALAAVSQAALVGGLRTFDQLKSATLGASALVGLWYVLVGVIAGSTDVPGPLAWIAVAAGIGLIAVSLGFIVGGRGHPLSVGGGVVAAFGSLAFQLGIGYLLLTGRLAIPEWNA